MSRRRLTPALRRVLASVVVLALAGIAALWYRLRPPDESGPWLSVSSVEYGFDSDSHEVRIAATPRRPLGELTIVHGKLTCARGPYVTSTTAMIGLGGGRSRETALSRAALDESVALDGTFFDAPREPTTTPCQLDFVLGSASRRGIQLPLMTACWDGDATNPGSCDPARLPVPVATSTPYDVLELSVVPVSDGPVLDVRAVVQLNATVADEAELVVQTICDAPGQGMPGVGFAMLDLDMRPFVRAPGEVVALDERLFESNHDREQHADVPTRCGIAIFLEEGSRFGEKHRTTIARACWDGEGLDRQPCAAATPAPVGPATASSLTIGAMELDVVAKRSDGAHCEGDACEFSIRLAASVTAIASIDPDLRLAAHAACRLDDTIFHGSDRSPWVMRLDALESGDTIGVEFDMLGDNRLPDPPQSCEIRIEGQRKGAPAIELARACVVVSDLEVRVLRVEHEECRGPAPGTG